MLECTKRYDDASAAHTSAIQTMARQVVAAPSQAVQEIKAGTSCIFIASLLEGKELVLDDGGFFGLEAPEADEDYEIQESDREEASRRNQVLQENFEALAQESFGQFANEAMALEREHKALKERLVKIGLVHGGIAGV